MTEFTNRRGVNVVEAQALRMQWFFRGQETSDQGIDAHVEKAPDGVGTGRLLAIQIKSGESYFSEPVSEGWAFRFNAKKAQLWLGHALPVLVVLVDVEDEVAYWQQISSRTVVSTGKGYKVVVPRSQTLSEADEEWTHIASGLETRAVDRFEMAVTQLPPAVGELLRDRPAWEHVDCAVLALHLAEGRANPSGTTESLLAMAPGWIDRHGAWAWQVLACYAAEHELLALSAAAFELAATAKPERYGRLLAAASLNLMHTDRARSEVLLDRAAATGHAALLVAVVRTLLDHPEDDAGPRRIPAVLLTNTDAVRTNPVVQNLLSDQAHRAGDLDAACQHARLALEAEPDNSGLMIARAEMLARRANSTRRQATDFSVAAELLERALDQRRQWSGPTLGSLLPLVRVYALNGQYEAMLTRCLAAPEGTALQSEAEHAHIRRSALYAAYFAGHTDLAEDLAGRIGDSVQDRIARLRTRTSELSPQQQRDLWGEELTRAEAEHDYENIAAAVLALASLGQDERDRLAPLVDRSIVAVDYMDLVSAALTVQNDLDTGLPVLRSLARRDLLSAELLIQNLTAASRQTEAAELCRVLYEDSNNPYLLIVRAQCLLDSGDDSAEAAALEAVNSTSAFPSERLRLLTYLAGRAADQGEWGIAERYLTEVLQLRTRPLAAEVWRVVLAQVQQGKFRRAAATLAEYHPAVTSRDEVQLWLQAHAAVVWNEAVASEALTLARRFDDAGLSAALLGQIVMQTRGLADDVQSPASQATDAEGDADLERRRSLVQGAVPAELHRQAFADLQRIATEFGDASGIRVLQGEPSDLAKQMAQQARDSAADVSQLTDLLAAARDSTLPQGAVASLRRQSYATLLVQRALGPLVSGVADDDEHLLDVHAAAEALGQPVVLEASTLLVLSSLADANRFQGQFAALQLPLASMLDIHRATFDIRALAGSPGTMGWDRERNSLVFWELTEDDFTQLFRRVQGLEDLAQSMTVRSVQQVNVVDGLGDDPQHAAWLHPIQLAKDRGIALWSDELGLRRLARHAGIACFGTPGLVDALRDRALRTSTGPSIDAVLDQTATTNRDLAKGLVVDVALHLDDLLHIAARDEWRPHAAGVVLSRASWWAWQTNPIQDLLTLYAHVASHNPKTLSDWQHAAMIGAGRAFRPTEVAAKILAALALLGFEGEPTTADAVEGFRRARRVASELGLADPLSQLPSAAATLAASGRCSRPEDTVAAVLVHFLE